jgi:tetratricopeptide (TPR) repeat protein
MAALAEAAPKNDSLAAIAASCEGLYWGVASGPALMNFALTFLDGELAARSGRVEEAIALLGRAAGMQDSLQYDEPPTWNMTARQSLGAVLLDAGRAAEAEGVYREDLKRFPENGWSLRGLSLALRARREAAEAEAVEADSGRLGRFRCPPPRDSSGREYRSPRSGGRGVPPRSRRAAHWIAPFFPATLRRIASCPA